MGIYLFIFKILFIIKASLSASPGNCTHLLDIQLTRSCEELLEFFSEKKSRCLTEPWRWPSLTWRLTRSSCPTFRTWMMSGRSLLSLLAFLWLLDSSLAATATTVSTREDPANQDQPTKTLNSTLENLAIVKNCFSYLFHSPIVFFLYWSLKVK